MQFDASETSSNLARRVDGPQVSTGSFRPRHAMSVFPQTLQPLLTLLTGKPLPEELPWGLTPWHHLLAATTSLLLGIVVSWTLTDLGGFWVCFLPASWLLTTHGARKLRTVIVHQCSHSNFLRIKKVDHALGKIICLLLVAEEFQGYMRSHVGDHHSARHQTLSDPTVAFLFTELGLSPGMSTVEMWQRLILTVLSPLYHVRFFVARIRSHFHGTTVGYRTGVVSYLLAIATAITVLDTWVPFVVSVVVPIGIFYHIAAAFRLASKHVFPRKLPNKRDRSSLGAFTLGIFMGCDWLPSSQLALWKRPFAWGWWWTEMLFFHLPLRLGVLVGDGPCHDYHHRHPNCADWANYIHNRERDCNSLDDATPEYREVWGLHRAIHACFKSLSDADPEDYPNNKIPNAACVILAADD